MCEAVRNNFTGVFITYAYGHNIANIVFLQLWLDDGVFSQTVAYIIESVDSISRDGPDITYA